MTTHIFLADDHPVVRQGMRKLIESEPNFEIVGEAENGLQAVREIMRLKPDIAILDIVMPDISGIEITRQINKRSTITHVIILSMYSDEAFVKDAFRSGAYGYVIKQSPPDTLITAVKEVALGQYYLSPPFSERGVQAYIQINKIEEETDYEHLTRREREMLHLVAGGGTNAGIAEKLNISVHTVEIHRSNMMRKLGLCTQNDLIRYAIQKGIIKIDS
jgi:two-component system, NarL family, response regulator NreC